MCTAGHCYWTRELSQLERKLLGSRSCDHCHDRQPDFAFILDTGMVFYICAPCHTHAKETQCSSSTA